MKQTFAKFPFYLILVSIYPVFSLFGHNITEVTLPYLVRPLVLSLLFSAFLFLTIWLITKRRETSQLVVSVLILGIMSYGVLFRSIKGLYLGDLLIGRQRFFAIFFVIILILLIYLLIRIQKSSNNLTAYLNMISLALLVIPLYQVITNLPRLEGYKRIEPIKNVDSQSSTNPDIYYIVLDAYSREDYIKQYINYDNSLFINDLRKLGFYVGDCSMSNYSMTRLSLSSSLNMEYIPDISPDFTPDKPDEAIADPFIIHNKVRTKLESLGYQTVAFETGYPFTEMTDADYYFQAQSNPAVMNIPTEFEKMVLENSFISVFLTNDRVKKILGLDFPYQAKYNREKNILNKLAEIPKIPGSKFVFVHLVTTHKPYIYTADGKPLMDERFYGNDGVPVNDDYLFLGYRYQLEYTNKVILSLVKGLLENSDRPPVIILQGDHGLLKPGRTTILNAIFMPGGSNAFYPEMSPVNTFGIIFNQLFSENNPKLPDISYYSKYVSPFQFEDLTTGRNPCNLEQ